MSFEWFFYLFTKYLLIVCYWPIIFPRSEDTRSDQKSPLGSWPSHFISETRQGSAGFSAQGLTRLKSGWPPAYVHSRWFWRRTSLQAHSGWWQNSISWSCGDWGPCLLWTVSQGSFSAPGGRPTFLVMQPLHLQNQHKASFLSNHLLLSPGRSQPPARTLVIGSSLLTIRWFNKIN